VLYENALRRGLLRIVFSAAALRAIALSMDAHELATTIFALVPTSHHPSDKAGLRKAIGRIQIGHCHHRDFLHEHVLMPKSIDKPALHPLWPPGISRSGNMTLTPSMNSPP
jgi:hypothetical protein